MSESQVVGPKQSLLFLYEQNYILFRLLLPALPKNKGWSVLKSQAHPNAFLYPLSRHAYTSEWLLGYHFAKRTPQQFSPDYVVRVYHDARLVEARLANRLAVNKIYDAKQKINQDLYRWLGYLHRHHYQLGQIKDIECLPDVLVSSC